ncbi:GDP-mannose 4,6-dehydratase [Candidatus Woesearchaeota archaeon]|nr:GDP-mannose 4,6-dehydratase [Candidatus Woesearchaeota archaeon]
MKALITGINGFVGPYLKSHLEGNSFQVVGTDIHPGEHVDVVADIQDKDKVLKLIAREKPELIFHLAAQSSVKLSWEQPELTRKVNVEGTRNLLDAVLAAGIEPKILLVSSADVYGIPAKLPLTEESPLKPISPYGHSRLEQEQLALSYNLLIIISRSFTHTGPGQNPIFVCSDFAKQVVEVELGKRKEVTTGELSIKRDIIDVRDMVKAYLLALQKGKPKDIFNICGGKSYSLKEILGVIISLSGKSIPVRTEPGKIRKHDTPVILGDNSKFSKAAGWKPTIPLSQTLNEMVEDWRRVLGK